MLHYDMCTDEKRSKHSIVAAGIVLALFTYRYYLRWIRHLERGGIDTDKAIYFYLSLFVSSIGLILLISMILI